MEIDPVLGILALLILWLLIRIWDPGGRIREDTEGRREVKVKGVKGLKVIETLPPRPLAFGAEVSVPGGPEEDGPFSANLGDLTCTCPDFRSYRARLPDESVGRICAHLSSALRSTGATGEMDELLRAIVEGGPTHRVYYEVPLDGDRRIAVGHTPGSDLLDVIAEPRPRDRKDGSATGPYRRYGFSRGEGRWLRGEHPPGSGAIGEAIQALPLE